MLFRGVRVAMVFLPVIREFADVMALTGAAEDQQTGRQHETGSAKKKSHNASESKRRGLDGARRKARGDGGNAQRSTSNVQLQRLRDERDLYPIFQLVPLLIGRWTLSVGRWTLDVSFRPSRHSGLDIARSKEALARSFSRNEIERAPRRITVSRSGPNYQTYRVE